MPTIRQAADTPRESKRLDGRPRVSDRFLGELEVAIFDQPKNVPVSALNGRANIDAVNLVAKGKNPTTQEITVGKKLFHVITSDGPSEEKMYLVTVYNARSGTRVASGHTSDSPQIYWDA